MFTGVGFHTADKVKIIIGNIHMSACNFKYPVLVGRFHDIAAPKATMDAIVCSNVP